jgi:hypothetical protein
MIIDTIIEIILVWFLLQNAFKIGYYETKLKNRNVDISRIKNMPIYKLWLN